MHARSVVFLAYTSLCCLKPANGGAQARALAISTCACVGLGTIAWLGFSSFSSMPLPGTTRVSSLKDALAMAQQQRVRLLPRLYLRTCEWLCWIHYVVSLHVVEVAIAHAASAHYFSVVFVVSVVVHIGSNTEIGLIKRFLLCANWEGDLFFFFGGGGII